MDRLLKGFASFVAMFMIFVSFITMLEGKIYEPTVLVGVSMLLTIQIEKQEE